MEFETKVLYDEATKLLEAMRLENGLSKKDIEQYFEPPHKAENMSELFGSLMYALRTRQRMSSIISDEIIAKIEQKNVLLRYNPESIYAKYGVDHNQLFMDLKRNGIIPEQVSIRNQRSLWHQFLKGVLSGAKFMSNFSFAKITEFFDTLANSDNDYIVYALPMLLDKEIYGVGMPLACEFLKESGYSQYAKADVHVIDVIQSCGLIKGRDDYEAFKIVRKMADILGKTPYKTDKVIWLVCSGNFYDHTDKVKVKHGRKAELIKNVKNRINRGR